MYSDARGFTLIELLIAITVFAIGLLSLAGMQITAIKTNSSANTLSTATGLAEGIMEQIQAWQPGDPRVTADGTNAWAFPGGATWEGIYQGTYTVAVDTPVNNVARITVQVRSVNATVGRTVSLVGYKKIVGP